MAQPDLSNVANMGDKAKAKKLTGEALKPFLVEGFSQDSKIREALGANSDVRGGVCLALSLNWIRLHQSAKHSPRLGVDGLLTTQTVINKARMVQLNYEKAQAGAGKDEAAKILAGVKHACNMTHMTLVNGLTKYTFPSDALVASVAQVHRYNLIALAGFGAGHATASYYSSGKILGYGRHLYFFDPNIGEFKIPEADIVYVFDALSKRYALLGTNFNNCYAGEVKA
jgi:hypothetical protein